MIIIENIKNHFIKNFTLSKNNKNKNLILKKFCI